MTRALRLARAHEAAAICALVRAAYLPYVARIGREPMPMLDDYGARIAAGQAQVLEDEQGLLGVLVLEAQPDALLLDNIALAARGRGQGLATWMIAQAEAATRAAGHPCLRLYTNAMMTENLAIYAHLGFRETHREAVRGLQRVYMEKRLTGD